jgi:hypothetical protein
MKCSLCKRGKRAIVLIEAPEGGFRALLTFDPSRAIMESEIEYATLVIPYAVVSEEIDLSLHPVSASWDAGTVSLDFPWENPEGDYMALPRGMLRLHPGKMEGKDSLIDVTEQLREIQNGKENHGFLVMPTAEYGRGFSGDIAGLFENAGTLVCSASGEIGHMGVFLRARPSTVSSRSTSSAFSCSTRNSSRDTTALCAVWWRRR